MTAAPTFDEDSQEIQAVQEQTGTIIETARTLTITADEDVERASVVLKSIAETKKGAEERRQFFVKPMNDQVKKINDLFKELVAPLLEADTTIRRKVSEYRSAQAEIARKEQERLNKLAAQQQARLDKKAETKGVEAPKITAPVVAAPPTKVGNVVARKVWKFEITDTTAVPRQFLAIDEQAIRAAVREGVREIAGVRIYQEEEIAVR
jgi:hypothetical protein